MLTWVNIGNTDIQKCLNKVLPCFFFHRFRKTIFCLFYKFHFLVDKAMNIFLSDVQGICDFSHISNNIHTRKYKADELVLEDMVKNTCKKWENHFLYILWNYYSDFNNQNIRYLLFTHIPWFYPMFTKFNQFNIFHTGHYIIRGSWNCQGSSLSWCCWYRRSYGCWNNNGVLIFDCNVLAIFIETTNWWKAASNNASSFLPCTFLQGCGNFTCIRSWIL